MLDRHLSSAAVTGGGHISNRNWLYLMRRLSLHSSADRPVTFNRLGNTESHVPASQFRLSRLATKGLPRPRRSRKICSFWSRSREANTHKSHKKEKLVLRESRAFYSGGPHNYVNVQLQPMLSYLAQIASRFVG